MEMICQVNNCKQYHNKKNTKTLIIKGNTKIRAENKWKKFTNIINNMKINEKMKYV